MKYKVFSIILIIITILLGASTYYFYQKSNPTDPKTLLDIKQNISKVVQLPEGEPTAAQIENVEELKSKNPDIYRDVEVKDIIFLYKNVIVIYRPSTNKIISIIPISTEN